ncbi:hypothetical protein F5Y16DRAFT_397672 [Xylariaceae sp. FL0255]|nr:hypothetical protein F5Y16DRAFT_397672 [Xylariaceae sp. FL0255]
MAELQEVAPPPSYSQGTGISEARPTKQPPMSADNLPAHNNSGAVRVPSTLGFEPAWVDCAMCEKRRETRIEKVPSEETSWDGLLAILSSGIHDP